MKRKKAVIALGGNAILRDDASALGQQKAIASSAEYLADLIEEGYELVITHGNGPQVGNLLLQQMVANSKNNPAMPLDTCGAMTEGAIGYWLQNALDNVLDRREINKKVAALVTQVEVSAKDPAFTNPSKPIGPFLSETEAQEEGLRSGATFKEDAGRGWRKVVPSPLPISIRESSIIEELLEEGVVTIAAGGGGVPVVRNNEGDLQGIEAVIDKDFASQTLADLIDADLLIILTGVDYVYINYNKPNQTQLKDVTTNELMTYIDQGQFAAGSMLPKVSSAILFAENNPKRKAVITSLNHLSSAIHQGEGTWISKEKLN